MRILGSLLYLAIPGICLAAAPPLDQRPATEQDWGYRPAEAKASAVNPPGFCWRPQSGIVSWELACESLSQPSRAPYRASDIEYNVHCPPTTFPPGEYRWRYRGITASGESTEWSRPRTFSIDANSVEMPMPERAELLARIPQSHPRLFIRPEDVARLRQLAQGPLKEEYKQLVARSEQLMRKPPPTAEPPKYPSDTERKSETWREIWWGNRVYTINALDGAATLAFTRLLGGKEEYGQLAKRILLDCAKWDPKGATGYRYNDEAGMPYAYYFSRTYTFVNDLLSEEERETCRRVMKIRGDEMYKHLCPRHLWQPYASHSNRAWHFLGEVGIAFLGEIEGADEWVWFAMNVFYNAYPVWCDDDGGWHEGSSYWSSYISRFTWWADVMRAAMGIDAYRKPYFSQIGYYPMYLMPPGKRGGGFGDLTANRTAKSNVPLMSILAAQAGNPYWQWYVEAQGGPQPTSGYVGFVRGALPKVEPKRPDDLPTSRVFQGIGQAYLNTSLIDADNDVQVVFKSSPFGTQSHGYEANNSFLLWAYGQRLLIRSGYRDIYGSDHHKNWMWSTRSVNNITVNGQGQLSHSAASQGRISYFRPSDSVEVVIGEAGEAYRKSPSTKNNRLLNRFTRAMIFVKPELLIVFDRLEAPDESTFTYWLHATDKFAVGDGGRVDLQVGDVACPIMFLAPQKLAFSQTDQYDPNPRPRIKLREWHLTATTAEKARSVEFVTLFRPHRVGDSSPGDAKLERVDGGYVLTAALADGSLTALLPTDDSASFSAAGLSTTGSIVVQRRDTNGKAVDMLTVGE